MKALLGGLVKIVVAVYGGIGIKGIIAALVAALVAWNAWNGHRLKVENEQLQTSNTQLQEKLTNEISYREELSSDVSEMKVLWSDVIQEREASGKALNDLQLKYRVSKSGKTRDIGKLAIAKPGLIESVINKGHSKANQCLTKLMAGIYDEKNCD